MIERQILHIDVNNAFLSWTAVEMLKQGYSVDIREIPSIIGGDETRRAGIVLAKSIQAKQFNIVTGETIFQAKRKCPSIQVYRGLTREEYKEYSNNLYKILLEYTEIIERFSIDECFLDMTNYLMNDTLLNKATEISRRVKEELGFTVNIGVAHNKLLAKMASDFEKPDKIHTLFEDEIKTKMWNLPVSELFMLGKKTVPKLYNMKIKTIGDLAKSDRNILVKKFGKFGNTLWKYANGIDTSTVNNKKEKPKSIGNSVTLPRDLSNMEDIKKVILELVEQVSYRLRRENLKARTVSVILRTRDFRDFSHQKKLDFLTCSTNIIYNKSIEILQEMYVEEFYRLVGVRVDNLQDKENEQISFLENITDKKQEKLDGILDNLKGKYGSNMITRARLLDKKQE